MDFRFTLPLCIKFCYLLTFVAGWGFPSSVEFEEKPIDFTDMGSYSHGLQRNLNSDPNRLKAPGAVEEENVKITRYKYHGGEDSGIDVESYDDARVISKVRKPEPELDLVGGGRPYVVEVIEATRNYGDKECPTIDDSSSMKFLKRVVASLLRQMNVQGHVFGPGEAITIDLQAEISHADFMILNKFVKAEGGDGGSYLPRVDSILSNMLHVVVLPLPQNFLEVVKDTLIAIVDIFLTPQIIITVLVLSFVASMITLLVWKALHARSVYHLLSYGFLVIFLISCIFNFIMLYETAKAENRARIVQTPGPPTDCDLETMGWLEYIGYQFRHQSGHDRCLAYYKNMVDPFWNVSPVEAISQTLARLFFHPAEYVGEKLGGFFYGAVSVFPFWLKPFVLLLMFFFTFAVVFGFKVKSPLLSIESRGISGCVSNGHHMLPESQTPPAQQQIAEKPAAEVVKVKTRDACVDTSDFEEYLRTSSGTEEEEMRGRQRTPELPPAEESFISIFPFLKRFTFLFKLVSHLSQLITYILDRILRCVPVSTSERMPISVD